MIENKKNSKNAVFFFLNQSDISVCLCGVQNLFSIWSFFLLKFFVSNLNWYEEEEKEEEQTNKSGVKWNK